jgi:hypothetical protein
MLSSIKLLLIIISTFFIVSNSYANIDNFDRLELITIKNKNDKHYLKKSSDKKFLVVFSGSNHNKTSPNLVAVPVVKNSKKYHKNEHKIKIKIKDTEYLVLTNKLKTISKKYAQRSMIFLNQQERNNIETQFNNILK